MSDARDFTTVTEVPGNLVSREAIEMAWTRYAFAGMLCEGKTVLEVACGPGTGLGYLAGRARAVVGGDYTFQLLTRARAQYGPAFPLVRLDAHALPFRGESFDVIILFEAIYFFADISRVIDSCRRVLAPGGTLLVVTVNPEWPAFNPSPYSTRYLTASELEAALVARGFSAEILAGFPAAADGWRGRITTLMKQAAVRCHLMPKTMKGKVLLKRLVFGTLVPFPADITRVPSFYRGPVQLGDGEHACAYKVLYAVARKDNR